MVKQKVLEFLNNKYGENVSDEELLSYLVKYRKLVHPDSHVGDEGEYTKRFTEASNLITEYKKEIESKTKDLVLRGEIVTERPIDTLLANIELEEKNKKLIESNDAYKKQLIKLQENMTCLETLRVKKEVEGQIKLFKPSKKDFSILGSTFGISTVIGISSQFGILSESVKMIFPFSLLVLQVIMFTGFIGVLINILFKNYVAGEFQAILNSISTRKIKNQFLKNVVAVNKNNTFSENDIIEFIENYIKGHKIIKLYFYQNRLAGKKDIFLDICTDEFISYSFENKVIKSYTSNRPIKSYSLNPIDYGFDWQTINLDEV